MSRTCVVTRTYSRPIIAICDHFISDECSVGARSVLLLGHKCGTITAKTEYDGPFWGGCEIR